MPKEISLGGIAMKILLIRGKRIMLGQDLARLYAVSTKRLNEQVKRNIKRFPPDFMFRLNKQEADSLRSHFATLNVALKGSSLIGKHPKYLPYAFTEQGVAMLSSVLNSERAMQVNIQDKDIKSIFEVIRQLMAPSPGKKRIIEGFRD
jgi:hypothetical protein